MSAVSGVEAKGEEDALAADDEAVPDLVALSPDNSDDEDADDDEEDVTVPRSVPEQKEEKKSHFVAPVVSVPPDFRAKATRILSVEVDTYT